MKITQVEELSTQMVEFDGDVRYLRVLTPGCGFTWFLPVSSVSDPFRFVLVTEAQNKQLEVAYYEQQVQQQ